MTKSELIRKIAKETGVTIATTELVISEFISNIIEETKENKKVEIRGFGSFFRMVRKARKARNFHTSETIEIPETSRLDFKSFIKF